jgi:multicomponent Na+:H+ antiporter subunit F
MTFLEISLHFFFGALAVSLLLALFRLLRGPDAANRYVALDLIGLLAAAFFAGHAIATKDSSAIDIVLIFSLMLFFGTAAFANLLHQSKQQADDD